ncbi:glucose dehydrogenase [FAD, quinone]-like [Photinus pyralis]|nr:glucose dehydrogenase [FAD, quinone]-like [Photinus pyralis]
MKLLENALGALLCSFLVLSVEQDDKNGTIRNLAKIIREEASKAYKRALPKDAFQYAPKEEGTADYGTFDHIIVGAGSAGAVIASRLSEDASRNVLVLEAGGYSNNFSDVPAMLAYLNGLGEYNWGYLSVPQNTSCLALKNHQCIMYRGKGVGGSSMINALLYVRGNQMDYDNWYGEGNDGWSYRDVLPYFKKSEDFPEGDLKYHGKSGNLKVEVPRPESPQIDAFLEANKYLGRKELDYNGEEQLGYARTQLNIDHGKRASSGYAFLCPAKNRTNLKILTQSYATKIEIDERKRAVGVRFTKDGHTYLAKSRQDIVISAGAFGSPQLLMLSGIGPREQLQRLGIDVIQDLPVGEQLLDHTSFFNLNFATNHSEQVNSLEKNVGDYLNGTGVLINPFNLPTVVFMQTKNAKTPGVPDFEALMIPSISSSEVTAKFWNIREELIARNGNPQSEFSMLGVLLHPKSRGYLRLKSQNPFDYPIINPNWLSDPKDEDIDVLYEGIKMILEMVDTPPFQKLNTRLKHEPLSTCKSYQYLSREYWHCFIRHFSTAIFHPIATCKMGTHPSRGAVVSPELKVFGVSNLRVADTSVFPLTTSGHTNAPAMMAGEKAADLIKHQ